MGEAQHRLAARRRKGIKRRRLHLDGENAVIARPLDRRCGLAKGGVCGPGGAAIDCLPDVLQGAHRGCGERAIGLGEFGWRQVMVARALVTQGAVDQHEIGTFAAGVDLPRRGHADQKAATGDEQLFGEQDRKRGADRAADYPEPLAFVVEFVKLGVIAGPAGRPRGAPGAL